MKNKYFLLYFYVPKSHLEKCKKALFSAGAGRYQRYSHCAWQVLGEGQFKPLAKSHPFLGNKNKIQKVKEYRVEMLCAKKDLKKILQALKKSHPYETPAYGVIALNNA